MSGISGGGKLGKLAAKIRKIAEPGFRRDIVTAVAEEALSLTQGCFRSSTDPYGNTWTPLMSERARNGRKGRASKPLRDTGRLSNSIHLSDVSDKGFRIGTAGIVYAAVHQFGHQFAERTQSAIRIGPGQIMFVREDEQWSHEMGKKRWKSLVRKAGASTKGTLPATIGSISRVFKVKVAPRVPARPYLPQGGRLPNSWRTAIQEAFDEAVKVILK